MGITLAQFFGRKRKEKKNAPRVRPRDGHVERVCKISGSYLLKTAWTSGLLCVKMSETYVISFRYLVLA